MFPVTETPEKGRESADINTISTYGDQVRADTVHFTDQDPYVFDPFRDVLINSQHSLYSHYKSMVIIHRSQVIHPVHKRDDLLVGQTFAMLFETAVKISHMGYRFLHNFAIGNEF